MTPTGPSLADRLRDLLQGETLRFIGYGAIVVVFLATRIASAIGLDVEVPTLDAITLAVGAAVAAVTEFARKFVWSPNSAARLVALNDLLEAQLMYELERRLGAVAADVALDAITDTAEATVAEAGAPAVIEDAAEAVESVTEGGNG